MAVVIPTWNGADCLPAAIRSLARQTYRALTIVVVDNGSTDGTSQALAEVDAETAIPIVVLRNAANLGFAGGVNVGIRHSLAAGFSLVAMFNNDAVAEPDWLQHLVQALKDHPTAAIATGRLLMGDGNTVDSTGDFLSIWGIAFPRDRDQPVEPVRPSGFVFAASGGASLYRAAVFETAGLFDERFFAYYEDVDLSFRAQLAGMRVFYCADAVARHFQGTTSRRLPGFATRQTFQNLPLLLAKNLPARLMPTIGPRFALLYPLMLANAIRRGEGFPALAGALSAGRLILTHAVPLRRRIQRSRSVDSSYLRGMLWPDLPPGMVVARAVRTWLRAARSRLSCTPPGRRGLPTGGGQRSPAADPGRTIQ